VINNPAVEVAIWSSLPARALRASRGRSNSDRRTRHSSRPTGFGPSDAAAIAGGIVYRGSVIADPDGTKAWALWEHGKLFNKAGRNPPPMAGEQDSNVSTVKDLLTAATVSGKRGVVSPGYPLPLGIPVAVRNFDMLRECRNVD